MKKKYFIFISLTLIFVMLLLSTGCGVKIDGKDYVLFKSNEKNNIFENMHSESSVSKEISAERENSEELSINNNSGNIEIEKSDDSKITIETHKKVKGPSAETKKKILDNINVKIQKDNKKVSVVVKTNDGKDFWEWLKQNYMPYQVTLNYKVLLPVGINIINADTGAGNITVEGAVSQLSLNTGAGNIDVNDVSAVKDNKLSTGAGNINFNGNIAGINSFNAKTGVGNVEFLVPEDTKMSVEADTGVGVLTGNFLDIDKNNKFHFKGDINGGGPQVILSTGVGNVKVDKD